MTELEPATNSYNYEEPSGAAATELALKLAFGEHSSQLDSNSVKSALQVDVRCLTKIKLYHGRYKSALRVHSPNSIDYMQSFPSKGSGRHVINGKAMTSTTRKGLLAEPGELRLSYGAEFEHLAVFLDPSALSGTLAALIGAPTSAKLELDFSTYDALPEARVLRRLISLLTVELNADGATASPIVTAELEQAVLVAFLSGNPHNHSRLLESGPLDSAPWQLRRVEEYIEANWDQPISIEALAIVTGSSARSIFHSFKSYRGYSPMRFVKQVRLEHVREILSKPCSGMTVTSAAFACGFGNLGHFAGAYQRVFGETPSTTLSRTKGHQDPFRTISRDLATAGSCFNHDTARS
jgi:AraC-like DNA-binding protein